MWCKRLAIFLATQDAGLDSNLQGGIAYKITVSQLVMRSVSNINLLIWMSVYRAGT